MNLFFLVLASYFLGSIPFSFLVAKARGVVLNKEGTRNIGASNVVLTSGFVPGIIALAFDIAKGFVPVIFAKMLIGTDLSVVLVGLAAVIGHDFPVYLNFRGGKGFATTGGVFWAINPYLVFVAIAGYWAIYFFIKKFIPTTILLLTLLPIIVMFFNLGLPYVVLAVCFALLAYYTHRNDIIKR